MVFKRNDIKTRDAGRKGGSVSYKHSETTRKKISQSMRGKMNRAGTGMITGLIYRNQRIRAMIFKKFRGRCQDCGKLLEQGKRGEWVAHHNDKTLKRGSKAYYTSEERILLCEPCHKVHHPDAMRFKEADVFTIKCAKKGGLRASKMGRFGCCSPKYVRKS